jgi:hypothetical protein
LVGLENGQVHAIDLSTDKIEANLADLGERITSIEVLERRAILIATA